MSNARNISQVINKQGGLACKYALKIMVEREGFSPCIIQRSNWNSTLNLIPAG